MNASFEPKKQEQGRPTPQNESQSAVTYPSRTIVHAKLKMTDPGDRDEQEADTIANEVVNGGKVARKVSDGGGASGIAVPRQMESRLMQLHGAGQPMPQGLQGMMEGAFGQEFPQVRLHTDSEAASLSSSIQAKAFTHGNDIYFNQGQFAPDTADGQHLVAHELAHVVQGGSRIAREPGDPQPAPAPDAPQPAPATEASQPAPATDAPQPAPGEESAPEKEEEYVPESDESVLQIQPSETSRIKKLQTRRERALFLFGDKADAALAQKRIYNTIEEAKADMKSVKLDVLGRGGKDVTIEMSVHYKLAEYVKEMFAEVKRAYSAPDNEEVFLFDEEDKDRGGYNWRYKRDDLADNLRMIGNDEDKIQGLGLDSGMLEEVEKIAAISKDDQRSKKVKEFKSKHKTGTKSIDTEFNKKIDTAVTTYRNIYKLRGYNAEIEKRTNELNEKNEQLRKEIDDLKAQREEWGKQYEESHHKIQTIEGIKDDKRLSSSLQTEMELINSESEDRRENLVQLLEEKKNLLQEYGEIQIIRNKDSKAVIEERDKLKKKKDDRSKTRLDLLYKSSDTIQSEMDGLQEEIELLDSLVKSDLDGDREKARDKWQGKLLQQVSMEEEISNDFYKTVVKKGTEQKVLDQKKVSGVVKEESNIKGMINEIDKKIKTKEGQINENNKKMPEYIKTRFSEHASGVAMDINPNTNPFYDAPNLFWKGEADKEENAKYFKPSKKLKTLEEWRAFHRDKDQYAIKPDSKLVKIFRSYGWNWGGGWNGSRDYMHFEWFSKTWPKEKEEKKKKDKKQEKK